MSNFYKIGQTRTFGICGFQHPARHPGLPSIPLDAHLQTSMDHGGFRLNYGMRGELCPKPFESLTISGISWIPQISVLLVEQEDTLLPEEELLLLLLLLLDQEDLLLLPEEVGLPFLDIQRPSGSTLWANEHPERATERPVAPLDANKRPSWTFGLGG